MSPDPTWGPWRCAACGTHFNMGGEETAVTPAGRTEQDEPVCEYCYGDFDPRPISEEEDSGP